MGNYQTCMHPASDVEELPLVTIVVQEDSGNGHRIVQLHGASKIQVAEIMLDYPNRYVCHSTCVLDNNKALPLPADHELQFGNVYLLVPVSKLHRHFSQAEAEHFTSLLHKYSNQGYPTKRTKVSRGKRVSPLLRSSTTILTTISSSKLSAHQENKCESGTEGVISSIHSLPSPSPILGSNESSDLLFLQEEMEKISQMMRISRSWMPKLETINESSLLKC